MRYSCSGRVMNRIKHYPNRVYWILTYGMDFVKVNQRDEMSIQVGRR
jgi:hypothetical protein